MGEQQRPDDSPIEVIVADDHPLFREGVVHALNLADGIVVVGEAADAGSALHLALDLLPDVALLDVTMPGSGLQAAREIVDACPATRVVMLTVAEDEDKLFAALKSGAAGYVLKGVAASELAAAVRAVHAGDVYIAPPLAGRVLVEMSHPRPANALDDLTTREREVLELVATGLSNQEIGARLSLAEKTIKHYMTNILGKLRVRSRVEAALLAQRAMLEGGEPDH